MLNIGNKSFLFGMMYESDVRAIIHTSAISSWLFFKNLQSENFSNSWFIVLVFLKINDITLQQKWVVKVVDPSILSQRLSISLMLWVLGIWDFYLSQVSNAKLTNSWGLVLIEKNSSLVIFARLKLMCTMIDLNVSLKIW